MFAKLVLALFFGSAYKNQLKFKGFLLFILLVVSPWAWAKYQVCSITINSSDEIEMFQKFLPPQDFEFQELLPSLNNKNQDHSSHWFDLACEKDYRCDILVISGHFGGTFFGKSGYSLPTELMEEKACKSNCPGILSQVKEIFLFGCNTLASKAKDDRSYEEYLQVLLDDGMARELAERVVAYRYSPLGTPFYDRMNFIFSDSDTIYGFNQLSPLGEYLRTPLSNYFKSISQKYGSYKNYLDQKQHKNHNSALFQQMPPPHFTLNQSDISKANESEEQRKFFKDKCLLYDEEKPFMSRIQAMQDIFESKSPGLIGSAFFAIDYFINLNKTEIIEGQGRHVFRSIRTNQPLAKELLSYYNQIDFLPYIKLVYLNVLENFQWIDPFDLHIFRKHNLLELIKKPDPEAYMSVFSLIQNGQLAPGEFSISKKDLPEAYIQNLWSLLIFEKLKVINPEWQSDILEYCKNNIQNTPEICYQALNTLAHTNPRLEIAQIVIEFLNSEDLDLIYYTLRMLGQSQIEDYSAHKKIAFFLTNQDKWIQKEALEALGYLKTPYKDIQQEVIDLLSVSLTQNNLSLIKDVFWSLSQMNLKDYLLQQQIIQYALSYKNNPELFKIAVGSLQNTLDFSALAQNFFYNQLSSNEDKDFLLFLIKIIAKENNITDIGIHHSFLQFQYESSNELKQKALKNMSQLTWMHPEVQIRFLNYVKDNNLTVRRLAINILLSINNLEPKTLNEIKNLYEQENIKELKVFF